MMDRMLHRTSIHTDIFIFNFYNYNKVADDEDGEADADESLLYIGCQSETDRNPLSKS